MDISVSMFSTRLSWRTSDSGSQQQRQVEQVPNQKGKAVEQQAAAGEWKVQFAPEFDGINRFESAASNTEPFQWQRGGANRHSGEASGDTARMEPWLRRVGQRGSGSFTVAQGLHGGAGQSGARAWEGERGAAVQEGGAGVREEGMARRSSLAKMPSERAGLDDEHVSEPRGLKSMLDSVFVEVYLFLPIPSNLPDLVGMLQRCASDVALEAIL